MLPVIPQQLNTLIQNAGGQLSTYPFPPNVAASMSPDVRKRVFLFMSQNYIWPQVQERKQFETQWDKMLSMARASLALQSMQDNQDTRLNRRLQERKLDGEVECGLSQRLEISDTLIFDAVDRLTNLNHFIGFKDVFPARFEKPKNMISPLENRVYSPSNELYRSANCWLEFNVTNQQIYRKYWMTARHHYTYGLSFVLSDFEQQVEYVPRRMPDNSFENRLELTKVGVTFEPISLRKVWLNWRLPIHSMEYQGCPFFFEQVPRFAIVANPYEAQQRPFGFQNLETLPKAQYLFGAEELNSFFKAWQAKNPSGTATQMGPPEMEAELLWTFYPMLPMGVNPTTGQLDIDDKGELGFPYQRFIVQTFGNNLFGGLQEIIRFQRNFYPQDGLPLYGSAHIPTLDDGIYSDSIGTILENHYYQICKALMQVVENKDWINDPPAKIQAASPANAHDLNKKGGKIPVNSMQDFETREPYDLSQTTPALLQMIRDQAQTSAKTVDAILGKAMGSRTSATEASNIFQTAMSGVTTDVNMFAFDIAGGYANRLWDYTGRWVDPNVIQQITGSFGFVIKPEHFQLRLGLKWDVGSSFIDSITRQQNIKFLLQATPPGDPDVNRAYLIRQLLIEWNFEDVDRIVNDQGQEDNIQLATQQAIETYLGNLVMVDPDQDHAIAIKVKKSFLADHKSIWNTDPKYLQNGLKLVPQIQQHQLYMQLAMQMMQLQAMQQQGIVGPDGTALQPLQNNTPSPNKPAITAGQQRQQTGA